VLANRVALGRGFNETLPPFFAPGPATCFDSDTSLNCSGQLDSHHARPAVDWLHERKPRLARASEHVGLLLVVRSKYTSTNTEHSQVGIHLTGYYLSASVLHLRLNGLCVCSAGIQPREAGRMQSHELLLLPANSSRRKPQIPQVCPRLYTVFLFCPLVPACCRLIDSLVWPIFGDCIPHAAFHSARHNITRRIPSVPFPMSYLLRPIISIP
jgi:hypothetical protein